MQKIYEITRYAYTNVPLYIRIAQEMNLDVDKMTDEELWNAVPYVNKERFVESDSDCISVKYISRLYQNKLMCLRTSGSTGMYMNIRWDSADYNRSMLPLWMLRKKYYSIKPADKLVYFYTTRTTGAKEKDYEYSKNSMGISKALLSTDMIRNVYINIYEYNPDWMMLQPSVAMMLCHAKRKYELPDIQGLKYIEMTGEYLSEEVRRNIKEAFKCNIANQYGCMEANSIAYECPYGNMHCMTDNVHVINEDGKIYITTLRNYAMPFVKYGIGDSVEIDSSLTDCRCGCTSPVIKVNAGRECDYIMLENGNVHSSCIHRLFDIANICTDGAIKQYKVIQSHFNIFDIYVVTDEKMITDYLKELFTSGLQDIIGTAPVINIFVSEVLLWDCMTGKMKSFECKIE